MSRVTVLYYPDDITLLYTLAPLVESRHARAFDFTRDIDHVLRADRNSRLLLVRFQKFAREDNTYKNDFQWARDEVGRSCMGAVAFLVISAAAAGLAVWQLV